MRFIVRLSRDCPCKDKFNNLGGRSFFDDLCDAAGMPVVSLAARLGIDASWLVQHGQMH